MNPVAYFSNDNGAEIKYHMNHRFADLFGTRNEHEVMFRRISTYLFNNGHIDGNIVDLGAWIGDNALPWSKSFSRLGASHIIYAIDPSHENCQYIRDLAILNNIENITVIKKAISDKREVLYTNDNLTHCSFVNNDGYNTTGENSAIAWPLDDLFNTGEIDNVAFIHLDVEGMENRVVAGAKTLIDTYKPIIAFEQHLEQDPFIELATHIMEKGYDVYIINETLPGCRPDCRNFIAFPTNKFDENIGEAINKHLGQDVLECILL